MAATPLKSPERWVAQDKQFMMFWQEKETGHVRNRTGSGRKRKLMTEEEKDYYRKIIKRAQKVGATQAAREFSTEP